MKSRAQPGKEGVICSHPEKEGTAESWSRKDCTQRGPRSPM